MNANRLKRSIAVHPKVFRLRRVSGTMPDPNKAEAVSYRCNCTAVKAGEAFVCHVHWQASKLAEGRH